MASCRTWAVALRFLGVALLLHLFLVGAVQGSSSHSNAMERVDVFSLDDETGEVIPEFPDDGDAQDGGSAEPDAAAAEQASPAAVRRRGQRAASRVGPWVFGDSAADDMTFFAAFDAASREWRKRNAEAGRAQRTESSSAQSDEGAAEDGPAKTEFADNDISPEARRWRRGQRKAARDGGSGDVGGGDGKRGRKSRTTKDNVNEGGITKEQHAARRAVLEGSTFTLSDKVAALIKDAVALRRGVRRHLRGQVTNNFGLQLDTIRAALYRSSDEVDEELRNATTLQSAARDAASRGSYTLPLVILDDDVITKCDADMRMLAIDAKVLDADLERAVAGTYTTDKTIIEKRAAKPGASDDGSSSKETPTSSVPRSEDYAAMREKVSAEVIETLNQVNAVLKHQTAVHVRIMEAAVGVLPIVAKEAAAKEATLTAQINSNDESTNDKRRELKKQKKEHRDVSSILKEVDALGKYISGRIRRRQPSSLENLLKAAQWAMRVRRSSQFQTGDGDVDRVELAAYDLIQNAPLQSITNFYGVLPAEALKVVLCAVIPFGLYSLLVQRLLLRIFMMVYGGVNSAAARPELVRFFALPKNRRGEWLFVVLVMLLETHAGHFVVSLMGTWFGLTFGVDIVNGSIALKNRLISGITHAPPPFDPATPVWSWVVFATPAQRIASCVTLFVLHLLVVLVASPPPQYRKIIQVLRISQGRKLGSGATAGSGGKP